MNFLLLEFIKLNLGYKRATRKTPLIVINSNLDKLRQRSLDSKNILHRERSAQTELEIIMKYYF